MNKEAAEVPAEHHPTCSRRTMPCNCLALSTTTAAQKEPIRECFSCAICELTVFRDCCDAGLCQSHYVAHMHEAHDGPSLSDLAEFWDTHQGENRVVVSYPAPSISEQAQRAHTKNNEDNSTKER